MALTNLGRVINPIDPELNTLYYEMKLTEHGFRHYYYISTPFVEDVEWGNVFMSAEYKSVVEVIDLMTKI